MAQIFPDHKILARSLAFGVLLIVALLPVSASSQIIVVVPAKSKIDSLSSKELQKIFKGEPAGPKQLAPLQIVEFAPAGDDFYLQLYGANSYAIAKHWLRLIFSGARALPPKSFSEAAKFLGFLAAHDNAIGFLPLELFQQAKDTSIRAVIIDGRDFLHPQYLLRKKNGQVIRFYLKQKMWKSRQPPRSWFANLSIRRKIALPLMAALAVMLISVVLYFPQRHTQTLRQAYWREANRMAEAIVVAVALALEEHNFALLEQTVAAMRLDNNVSFLFLFDEAGDSLVAYNPNHVAFALAAKWASDDHIVIRREIGNLEQRPFGALLLGYSLEDMHRQAREYRIATFAFTTIAFVLGLIFINQISQRITEPLSRLHAQMQEIIAKGSYAHAPAAAFTDEIGSLAEVFKRMMSELQSRHERLRESQEKYRALYEKLKELDRLKSNFVSDASHHLRTPLTIIIGEIEVSLRHLRSVDEYRETLGIIEDEAKYLGKIVDNLLTLAKADAGNLIVPQADVDVAAICENEIKRAGILAKSKNLRLESRIARDCLITADPNRLAELIFNLLENAVKYTPAGKAITVTLENAPDNLVLQVADTGPGIPREDWERIFDRFYRGKLFSKKAKGAGLGLAICASIAKAHGGTISVASRLDEGSVFKLTLPRQAKTAQDLQTVAVGSENKIRLVSEAY